VVPFYLPVIVFNIVDLPLVPSWVILIPHKSFKAGKTSVTTEIQLPISEFGKYPYVDKHLDLLLHRRSFTDPISLAPISITLGFHYLIQLLISYPWPSLATLLRINLSQSGLRILHGFTHSKPFIHQWTMINLNRSSFVLISGQLRFAEQIMHHHNFILLWLLVECLLWISCPL
jgi:hypothetical protein